MTAKLNQGMAISNVMETLRIQFEALSVREKFLVIAGAVIVALFGSVYCLTDFVAPVFSTQKLELDQLDLQAKEVPGLVKRYKALLFKKERLEEQFRTNNVDLDEPSYVESIVKKHTKIDGNSLRISPSGKPIELGADFEQEAYSISFRTQEMKDVVDFLERTANGPQPLLITRIDVRRSGTSLSAAITLSSIRRKRAG
jgi:hypothetical protein